MTTHPHEMPKIKYSKELGRRLVKGPRQAVTNQAASNEKSATGTTKTNIPGKWRKKNSEKGKTTNTRSSLNILQLNICGIAKKKTELAKFSKHITFILLCFKKHSITTQIPTSLGTPAIPAIVKDVEASLATYAMTSRRNVAPEQQKTIQQTSRKVSCGTVERNTLSLIYTALLPQHVT